MGYNTKNINYDITFLTALSLFNGQKNGSRLFKFIKWTLGSLNPALICQCIFWVCVLSSKFCIQIGTNEVVVTFV